MHSRDVVRTMTLSCFLYLGFINSYAQSKNIDSINLVGKWTVCVSLNFSLNFECTKGYVTYEFLQNGSYIDPRPSLDGAGQHAFSTGKWSLIGNDFTIHQNDTLGSKYPTLYNKITFINRNLFYYSGTEGKNGPTVYTYYQRVK